jgi:hypothetical protein
MKAALNLECSGCGARVGFRCHAGRTCVARKVAVIWDRQIKVDERLEVLRTAEEVLKPSGRRVLVHRVAGQNRELGSRYVRPEEWAVARDRLLELGLPNFASYSTSKRWKVKRKVYLETHPGACCFICGSRERLSLHHTTYERLGKEHFKDLVPLCDVHHKVTHKVHVREYVPLEYAHEVVRARVDDSTLDAELVAARDRHFGPFRPVRRMEVARRAAKVTMRSLTNPRVREAVPFEVGAVRALGPATDFQRQTIRGLCGWTPPSRVSRAQASEIISWFGLVA